MENVSNLHDLSQLSTMFASYLPYFPSNLHFVIKASRKMMDSVEKYYGIKLDRRNKRTAEIRMSQTFVLIEE